MSHAAELVGRYKLNISELMDFADSECCATAYCSKRKGFVFKFNDGSIIVLRISGVYSLDKSEFLDEFLD